MTPNRWISACVCAAALTMSFAANAAARPLSQPPGPNAIGMSPNAGAIPAQVLANERVAYFYFPQQGLSGIQSAGIIGNYDIESGMDPASQQSGGPGRGIAQWSAGGRWDSETHDNVVWYATQHGQSQWSLSAQLDFTWYELTTFSSYGLAQLRAATTITAAVTAFQDAFEGCGSCNTSGRVSYAQAAYQRYGAGRAATAGGTTVDLNANELDYFSRSADGHLIEHPYLKGSGWQALQDLGSPAGGLSWDPDASSWGTGHLDVAARDASGHLVLRSYDSGSWSAWTTLTDTALSSSPTIVDDAVNHLSVFWLGANHQLMQRTRTSSGWGAVAAVPRVSDAASGPDATTWQVGSGRLDVTYRNTANQLMTVTYNRRWFAPKPVNPTRPLPAAPATLDPGTGSTGSGNFSVWVTAVDGNVYHASGDTRTGVWSIWYVVPGSPHATAAPDAATLAPSTVAVISAAAGVLITTRYTSGWSAWESA